MSNTAWELYTSNEETLKAMIEACEEAKETIELEQFICLADDFGGRLIDICARKAQEGVRVRFIWDAIGSFSFFGSNIAEDLKKKGVEIVFFKTLFPSFFEFHNYRSWYFRDHRRALIVDGKVGFTGSICLNNEYKSWHDTNVKVEGRVVEEMSLSFERMWNRANKRRNKNKIIKMGTGDFSYLTNSPIPRHKKLYHETLRAVRSGSRYIYMASPYFVPTHHLARAIRKVAQRGVDVRLMIPERSDSKTPDLCARTYFHSMLRSGVRIFLHKNMILHKKTIVMDDNWASVGTMNLDYPSLVYNFEGGIISRNTDFALELKEHFINDMENCEEITLEQWKSRYWIEKFAGFFLKFVRFFF
ncbi:MAG TPA: phospholipase D-like domain-containing protein [Candidatus Paceibacterota bacterium]